MSEWSQRFRGHMSDGRPTTGFDDGAEIFETEQDADGAARLLDAAFNVAYRASEARIAELEAMVRLAQPARLFGLLEHGDTDHRVWLSTAINAALSDRPVPEPSGKGRAEAAEAEAAALRELVREVIVHMAEADSGHCELQGAWVRQAKSLLSEKAETPATAGEG